MKYSRRQVIKCMAGVAGAHWLGACTTLDRIFMGESSDLTNTVVIVGAGLSGLVSAYTLDKAGVPCIVFEANSRLGGQIQTLNQYFGPGSWVDLGPEFFTASDRLLIKLVNDLGLNVQALSASYSLPSHLSGQELRRIQASWLKSSQALSLEALKSLSLAEWSFDVSRDPAWLQAVDEWSWYRAGVSSVYLSSGRFVGEFKLGALTPWLTEELSVDGGLGQIIDRLASQVFGAFPEKKLRLHHQLLTVERVSRDASDLVFLTPEGRRRYKVKNVILTQSVKALRAVSGMGEFFEASGVMIPQLNIKWARSNSWQKPYRKFGTEPRWGRGYQKIGAWGQVRAQKFIDLGLLHSSSLSGFGLAYDGETLLKDWSQDKTIQGRSLGGVIEAYQPTWKLPEGWFSSQVLSRPEYFAISPLELCVLSSQACATKIASARRT